MQIVGQTSESDIATVYIAQADNGAYVEFVESVQPPIPRSKKWVLIVSTLYGCPVNCLMCDAGGSFKGKLSGDEILWQIDYMVQQNFPNRVIETEKFKIQFARMGEPALNLGVLGALEKLPSMYKCDGLLPSLSTVAPQGCDEFFTKLIDIKNKYYSNNGFQLQFSIHTTDEEFRNKIIPIKKWGFAEISEYGNKFYKSGDKKITLNFALAADYPFDVDVLKKYFSPEIFLIKITPVNPTIKAQKNQLNSYIKTGSCDDNNNLLLNLEKAGYDVILSVGELEENKIGSNCGQFIKRFTSEKSNVAGSYEYDVVDAD